MRLNKMDRERYERGVKAWTEVLGIVDGEIASVQDKLSSVVSGLVEEYTCDMDSYDLCYRVNRLVWKLGNIRKEIADIIKELQK